MAKDSVDRKGTLQAGLGVSCQQEYGDEFEIMIAPFTSNLLSSGVAPWVRHCKTHRFERAGVAGGD